MFSGPISATFGKIEGPTATKILQPKNNFSGPFWIILQNFRLPGNSQWRAPLHDYTALSLCVGLISGKFWLDDYTLWTCLGRREYDCNCYNKLTLFKVICAQFWHSVSQDSTFCSNNSQLARLLPSGYGKTEVFSKLKGAVSVALIFAPWKRWYFWNMKLLTLSWAVEKCSMRKQLLLTVIFLSTILPWKILKWFKQVLSKYL